MQEGISEVDPIIGRSTEIDTILALLADHRLVTLTGPGGSGKTRLAEATVAALRARGGHGDFVDLSTVQDPGLVGATALVAFGIEPAAERDPLDVVIEHLGRRDAAIVALDNLEQFDDIGPFVLRILGGAPTARVLATSRLPLKVRGEVEFAVRNLAIPESPTPEAIEESPAGGLFLARARAVGRLRLVDEATAVDIVELLRRLDGIPLAIELAAARTRVLTPAEIVHRIDRLGPAAVDHPPGNRQRSLQGVLEWTIGLLDARQYEVLEAVSVCAGFDLEFAEALAPESDAVDAIEDLIVLGLIATSGTVAGTSRFRLLETIRAVVQQGCRPERLASLRDRQAERCVAIATGWFHNTTASGPEMVDRFDVDVDNMRRALDHLADVAPLSALDLLRLLEDLWSTRGRTREWYARFTSIAALVPEPSIELARAAASIQAAWQVIPLQDLRALSDDALVLATNVGDRPALIRALLQRAIIAVNDDDRVTGARIAAELESIESSGLDDRSRRELAAARASVSGALYGRASDEHVRLMRWYMDVASAPRWRLNRANAAANLSGSLLARGEYAEAVELAAYAIDVYRSLDRREDESSALTSLAPALAAGGRTEDAIAAALRCASLATELRSLELTAGALWAAVSVASAAHRPLLGAQLWGGLRKMEAVGDVTLSDFDRQMVDRWLVTARRDADAVAFELAIRDGESSDPTEMLASLKETLRSRNGPTAPAPRLPHGTLTKREVEILALIGAGRSDPEIAEALFISPKTASVHVSNIKAKLGLGSRLEIALYARDLRLTPD